MAELVKLLTTPAITGPRSLPPELEAIKEIALEDHEMAMAAEYVKPYDDIDEYLPYFSSRVYDILPAALRDIAEHFAGRPAERDVLTLSLITATSAILSHVRIHYDNHTYGPQGYTFIVGAAGTGKGVAASAASNLLMPIDQQLEDEWQHEHDVWQADNPDAKRGGPRQPQINIGADHTRPALIHAMSLRQEGVLILASEADALTVSLAKENGGYSAELRAAYHCEGIQQQRMDVERIARIDEPHLAVLMTGTPAQVPRLMSAGVEDGLYSRFLLYSIPGRAEWRNPYVNSTGEVFRDCRLLGKRLITTYKGLDSMTEPIWFDPPAFSGFSDTFGSHFGDMATDSRHGQWIAPVIMRHCLAATRVAMTLTCLRHGVPEDWRSGSSGAGNYIWERTGLLRPDEDDLIAASLIVEVCLQHSIYYGKRYLNDDHEATKRFQGMAVKKQEALYDELPSEFTGADLKEIAGELDIPHSTAQYWRKKWDDDDVIERLGHSNYRKCKL